MTPHGSKGEWKWNGWEITSMGTDTSGEPFQRKGKWMWLPSVDDRQNAWMANAPISEINAYYNNSNNTPAIAITLILIVASATGITLIIIL